MRNHHLLIVMAFLILSGNLSAKYNVYYDRPQLNGHYLNIGIMDMDFKNFTTWNLSYNLYLGNGKFNLHAEFANISNLKIFSKYVDNVSGLGSRIDADYTSANITPKKFELIGTFNFRQKLKRGMHPVFLYSNVNRNVTTRVYAIRNFTKYKSQGIRIGVGSLKSYFEDIIPSSEFTNNRIQFDPLPVVNYELSLSTRYIQQYFVLGLESKTLYKIRMSNLSGRQYRTSFITAYFDFLISPKGKLENIYSTSDNTKTEYKLSIPNKKEVPTLGWRIGVYSQAVRSIGLGTLCEVGRFPGLPVLTKNGTAEFGLPALAKLANYFRIGIYLSVTAPLQEQDIHRKW